MKEIRPVEQHHDVTNYQPQYDDTINLIEIISFFYAWRRTILAITLLGTLLAAFIAYYLPPQYKTTTQLTPPKIFQFNKLLTNTDLNIKADALFNQFTNQLKSRGNLLKFVLQSETFKQAILDKPNLTENEKIQLANELASNYKIINKDNKDNKNEISFNWVNLETTTPKIDLKATDNLAYIHYTNERVINTIQKEQKTEIKQQINQLKEKINIATQKEKIERNNHALRLRNDRQLAMAQLNNTITQLTKKDIQQKTIVLAQLTEAYELAKATQKINDITKPLFQLASPDNNDQQLIDINLNHPQTELYLKGTQYLQKAIALTKSLPHTMGYEQKVLALHNKLNTLKKDPQISLIEQRKNWRAYIPNLANYLTKLDHLQHLTFNTANVSAFNMENDPDVSVTPFSPNKKKIIVIGTALGFMFAIFVTLLLNLRRQLRPKSTGKI